MKQIPAQSMWYSKAIRVFLSRQFLVFLLVGGLSALVNFFSRFAFRIVLSYVWSVVGGYCVGTVASFFLNKFVTFKAYDEGTAFQFTKFVAAAVSAVVLAAGIAWASMRLYVLAGRPFVSEPTMESIAHLIAIGTTTLYNFLAMKHFAFQGPGRARKAAEGSPGSGRA